MDGRRPQLAPGQRYHAGPEQLDQEAEASVEVWWLRVLSIEVFNHFNQAF